MSVDVVLYKITNRLKAKLGIRPAKFENTPGHIDPAAMKEADELIRELCKTCPETLTEHLKSLAALWEKMRDMPEGEERQAVSQQVFTLAHEIKDVGSLCGFTLAASFAESLRDYVGQTELSLNAQRVIIQAHIDALQLVIRQGFKTEEEAGPAAVQLQKMVRVAIEKYK